MNDELIYHAGDLTLPARPESGMDVRQSPSGRGPKPDAKDDDVMDQDYDPMEGKKDNKSGLDLGALERDLLEYQFSEDDDDESVTEDKVDDHQTTKRQPIRRAKKGLKRLRSRAGSKTVNQKVIKTKMNAAVTLAKHLARVKLDKDIAGIGWGRKRKT